jgi:hypothetical protein
MRRPGETEAEYHQRFGIVTLCNKTRGTAVTTPHGHTVQLDPDECVTGDVITSARAGGTLLGIAKAPNLRGTIDWNGVKRLVDVNEAERRSAEINARNAARAVQQNRETE